MNLHDFCEEIVRFAANCPEATVSVWFLSAVLMLVQGFFVVRRLAVGEAEVPEPEQIKVPVHVPYVPNDTLLKLVKLLNNQETGWDFNGKDVLGYNNLQFNLHYGDVVVRHKNVFIDLEKVTSNANGNYAMDQVLLRNAYQTRVRRELEKSKKQNDLVAREAERVANKELNNILETI